MTQCDCKLLERFARDPKVPVAFNCETQTYELVLSRKLRIGMAYCWCCGGDEKRNQKRRPCRCGAVKRWAQTPHLPVKYDKELNEYNLVTAPKATFVFRFCPMCGGKMPASKRKDLFEKPTDKEYDEFRAKLRGAKSVEEVVRVLGKPDRVIKLRPFDPLEKEIYGYKDAKRALFFDPPGSKVRICVQELADDKLQIFYLPREKGKK